MDRMSRGDLSVLLRPPNTPCVSIYVPTHAEASWSEHDRIALKNLIGDAARLLVSDGMRRPDAQALLDPVRALLEDSFFWQGTGKGLAVFVCPGLFKRFRLPLDFEPKVVVAERFHIRPVMELFTGEGVFYVLALSTKGARLQRVTRFGRESVPMPTAPKDLADELRFDDFEKHVEFRTGAPGQGGAPTATFFGHGGREESVKEELLRYLRDVDRGLHDALRTEHGPVVLAGVRYFQAIFRSASSCKHLEEHGIVGSPEQMDQAGMIERARQIVRSTMKESVTKAMHLYRASVGRGLASDDVGEVMRAARAGRVGTLLSVRGRNRWGSLDPATGSVVSRDSPQPGDEDLTELATLETVLHSGSVFPVEPEEMPRDVALAAVYRY